MYMDYLKQRCSRCGQELNGLLFPYQKTWPCSDCAPDKTKILFAERGCHCRVKTFNAGYDHEKEQAKKLLELDRVYTVEFVEVGRSSSTVELLEFPGKRFNSVFFERVLY